MNGSLRALLVTMVIWSVIVTGVLVVVGPERVEANQDLGFGLVALGAIAVLGALIAAIRRRQSVIAGSTGAAAADPSGTAPRAGLRTAVILIAAISEGGLFVSAVGYAFASTAALLAVGAVHLLVFVILLVTVNSTLD